MPYSWFWVGYGRNGWIIYAMRRAWVETSLGRPAEAWVDEMTSICSTFWSIVFSVFDKGYWGCYWYTVYPHWLEGSVAEGRSSGSPRIGGPFPWHVFSLVRRMLHVQVKRAKGVGRQSWDLQNQWWHRVTTKTMKWFILRILIDGSCVQSCFTCSETMRR